MGFGQAVSGINAAASNLDVIGNNIANANTVGFKQSTAQFADVYAGSKIGLGVKVNSVVQSFSQGNLESSGRSLDVAITGGNGFFRMLSTDGQVYYSRNGQFLVNDQGFMTNGAGLRVTGYGPGVQPGGGVPPQPIVISKAQMPPQATTTLTAQYNLDSGSDELYTPAGSYTIPAGQPTAAQFTYSNTVEVYDSLGNAQQLTSYFAKGPTSATGTEWTMYVKDANGATVGSQVMQFDLNGELVTPAAGATVALTIPGANGAAAGAIAMDLAGTTQFADDNDPKVLEQNGFTTGSLLGYSIEADGSIVGSYSNEKTQSLGQIVLATFANMEGLNPEGDNVWTATGASGQALLAQPGGGAGQLQDNAVEASNVDLSGQLVNLIVAQRNYQANAQTIKAQDTVLQTLVNI